MIAEQWEHIKELFETALNCSPQEKQSLLTRLAEEDPGVAGQVLRLLASYEKAGDFLAEPCCPSPDFLEDLSAEQQRFFPGDVICGRFRIVSLLGRGGMGEVYKAWDEELEEHVALKTLRPDISTHELFTSRFRREMQLARKVTHPNVCRIFDSFKHAAGDGTYVSVLSMELLQGQTLAESLKARGRLTSAEAMPLVQQIVAGLTAIHAAGIIHRDLKPGNLVLVPGSPAITDAAFQIKITDFGIAGRLPDGLSPGVQTEASKLLGTPDYMAPEQLEGTSAGIQSDIYSLGLILYEMVTGAKPFAEASAWKRISSDAPSPRRLMRDLPENWNKAIVCCLERNPAYRFQSAQALLENLKDTDSAAKIPPKPFIIRVQRAAKAKAGLIAGFLLVAMALSYGYYRYSHQRPEIPSGTMVLVTDIATSDPALSGITVALKSQLAQSARFDVEEDSKVVEILKQMNRKPGDPMDARTAREVAWRSGVPLVVYGSLQAANNGYSLSINVERVKHSPIFSGPAWRKDFSAQGKPELFNAVHDASIWIRKLAGESDADLAQQDRPVEDTTTPSWQALQLYSEAERKYSSRDTDAAILLLMEAIQVDPGFAKAHMRLADILVSLKRYKEGYVEWQRAIGTLNNTQLTSRESLRLRGLYYADTGSYRDAESTFREYTLHYPDDYIAWFYLGNALEDLGQLENAVRAFARAAALQPTSYGPHVHLALLFLYLRRNKDLTMEIQTVQELGGSWRARWLTVYASFVNGDYDQAILQSSRLFDSSDFSEKSQAYEVRASLLAEAGRRREAIAVFQEGEQFDRLHGLTTAQATKLIGLAYLHYRRHDVRDSSTLALRAMELDESPQRLMESGTLLALAGDVAAAQACLHKAQNQPGIPRVQMVTERIAGEIQLAKRQPHESLVHFRRAAALSRANESQDALGRALAAAGFQEDAASALGRTAEAPAQVLLDRWNNWPGLWADSLLKYLILQSGHKSVRCDLLQEYTKLRNDSDAESMGPEDMNALVGMQARCRTKKTHEMGE